MQKRSPKLWLLVVAAVVHLAWSAVAVVPGHLSVDEGTYHMMVRGRAAGDGFEIVNGYREVPSPELVPATLVARKGRLAAVPPEGFTFLALPFYLALGYRGLFLLQALAFLATVAVCGHLARRLTGDRGVALDAMLLLAFATFLWDYSQAAWPHALATLLVTGALAATVEALEPGSRRRSLVWAGAAGLVAGVAISVRLDAAFVLPAVALPFLFARPPRWRPLLAAGAGLAPVLAALAAVNRVKFGVASPFSYGLEKESGEIGAYAAPLVAGAVAVTVAWLASRRAAADVGRRAWERRPAGLTPARAAVAGSALAVVVAAALVAAVPPLRRFAADAGFGLWQLVVDFRPRPESWQPALARTPEGGMVYIGALKKSLLQSAPWLAALVVPAATALVRAGRERRAVLLLALVPAAYLGFYGAFAWHGGLTLNLRYWTPALPPLAILGALAWRRLAAWAREGSERPGSERPGAGTALRPAVATGAVVLFLAAVALLDHLLPGVERQQVLYLDLPLVLALALVLLAGAGAVLAGLGRSRNGVARGAALVFLLAAAWSAFVTFAYDAPVHRAHRARNLALGELLMPRVPPDSLLLVNTPDPYYSLLEVPELRLAVPPRDGFADFRRLVDHHLDAGRPVLASFQPGVWAGMEQRGLLEGYAGRQILPNGLLVRLQRPPGDAPGAGAAPGREPD